MSELVEPPKNTAAERFEQMVKSLQHNEHAPFGGAAVIIPPADGGEPIEILILDLKADPAQFWATIKSRIDMQLVELDERSRRQQAFGRR